MPDLLFEIGTEELPPGQIVILQAQIINNIIKDLKENLILVKDNSIKLFSTPRRLAFCLSGLPEKQESKTQEIKGPAYNMAFDENGKPKDTAIGFAKKYNLQPSDLIKKMVNETNYVFAVSKIGGKNTKEILKEILPASIKKTSGEKYMKWGSLDDKFARPIRWIVALFDSSIIEFTYCNLKSSNESICHRFTENKKTKIQNPTEYEKILEQNYVIPNKDKRKNLIKTTIEDTVEKLNCYIEPDNELLEEVTNITEYPSAILCGFDSDFLELPECITKTVLKKHQRYFVLKKTDTNKLSEKFIVITNTCKNKEKNIVEQIKIGNEKVVKARLNDAKFFFQEDLKIPFKYETRIEKLSKITFQKGLGTLKDKVERVIQLSEFIYKQIEKTKKLAFKLEDSINAAKLCKLDLCTQLVFEMPELQGEIGGIYAKKAGFNDAISNAIAEQYSQTIKTELGAIISIADKIDNIISLFAIDKIPTGSADPFALRRQAQGIIDTLLDLSLNINLTELITYYVNVFKPVLKEKITDKKIEQIRLFLTERLITKISNEHKIEQDFINSVISIGDPLFNLTITIEKIQTINSYFTKSNTKGKEFLIAAKRLVRIVESKLNGNLDINELKTEQEKVLLQKFQGIKLKEYKTTNDFLKELSELTTPINNFFDKVLVNDPDPKIRQARQSLLKQGKDLFEQICDFNKIQDRI